ncbi:GtrA family protein [Actinospica sp.]|jgi:putative flippase GtrA|uniref:GtrA family protein n=1 Tax=Actinospica sp. TaxID=1872142 RepID=UPI002C045DF6|nr:GtrA family protein [Actinospica sp.]HWG28333.1 GtrA family protein [Actinospica sp.]
MIGTFLRYGAGSLVAMASSELVLVVAYNFGAGPQWAAILAWAAGAVPNYVLNRRWAWRADDAGARGGKVRELVLYWMITLGTAVLAVIATTVTDAWIKGTVTSRGEQSVLLAAAYLGSYGIVFVAKFVLFDRLVFSDRRSRHQVPSTTRA